MNIMNLSGVSLPKNQFEILEVSKKPTRRFWDIAIGKCVGEIVHDYLSPEVCEAISANFQRNPSLRKRDNGVPGFTVGVDQYKSHPDEYIINALNERKSVSELFFGNVNVPVRLREDLQRLMPEGIVVRPALYHGVAFNDVRAVKWTDNRGHHALKFHDDYAQLKDPIQHAFETASVEWPVAFNIYPSVTENGGELEIVNLLPDDQTRAALGISSTGYPYPEELLAGYERIVIKPRRGDLLILSGRFVHGVRGVSGSGSRILLNHFGGLINQDTFVTWS